MAPPVYGVNSLVNTDFSDNSGTAPERYPGWYSTDTVDGSGPDLKTVWGSVAGITAGPYGAAAVHPRPGDTVTASGTFGAYNATTARWQIRIGPTGPVLATVDIPKNDTALTITADIPEDYDGTEPVVAVIDRYNGTREAYLVPATLSLVFDGTEPEPDPDPDPEPGDPDPGDPDPDPEPGDPDPGDPDPEPEDEADPWEAYETLAETLAPRAAAFTGRSGDAAAVETARAQLPVVIEYVRGYTRGRGFDTGLPAGPLRAVIVSAVARLLTNPEQITYYSVGDYSERPAVLTGWTLSELAVLRRYRRTSA